jgi:limonene-1,2-epoxide hydrolase
MFTQEELLEAKRQNDSTLHKLRKTVKTFEQKENPGRYKSQITLAKRRIMALELSNGLIEQQLEESAYRFGEVALCPKEVVQLWVEAFNNGDAATISSLYHTDATNHEVANDPVVGVDSIRKMFEAEFSTAEMVCIVENIFEDGDWAILEWRDPLGLRGCGFFQVIKGKIQFQRGYWDKLSFLKQHNLPIE